MLITRKRKRRRTVRNWLTQCGEAEQTEEDRWEDGGSGDMEARIEGMVAKKREKKTIFLDALALCLFLFTVGNQWPAQKRFAQKQRIKSWNRGSNREKGRVGRPNGAACLKRSVTLCPSLATSIIGLGDCPAVLSNDTKATVRCRPLLRPHLSHRAQRPAPALRPEGNLREPERSIRATLIFGERSSRGQAQELVSRPPPPPPSPHNSRPLSIHTTPPSFYAGAHKVESLLMRSITQCYGRPKQEGAGKERRESFREAREAPFCYCPSLMAGCGETKSALRAADNTREPIFGTTRPPAGHATLRTP